MKTNRRAIAGIAITGVLASAAIVGLAAPASATSSCGTDQNCLWQNVSGGGTLFHSLNHVLDSFGSFNDQASSLYNGQAVTIHYYTDIDQEGQTFSEAPTGSSNNLGTIGFNDQLSSWTN